MKPYNPMPRFIETSDLLLRPWEPTDAYSLYEQAKDDTVATMAGWVPHTSPEYSMKVIEDVLADDYAIIPRSFRKPVGSIGLKFGENTNFPIPENECELGYWIGRAFWNKGYVTQAAKAVIENGFDNLDIDGIWCICRIDNPASARVQDKCGFRFVKIDDIVDPIYGQLTMRFTYMSRQTFISKHNT